MPARPSPPPCGWSFGFIALPRVWGRSAQVAASAGLAERCVLVLRVPDLPDGGHAAAWHPPDLAGRQPQQGVLLVASQQLRAGSCATAHLPTLSGLEFDVVNHHAGRNLDHRQRVPGTYLRVRARHQPVVHLHPAGGEDVAPRAVGIEQQRDACRPVRVVLDGLDTAGDARLVALEIDVSPGSLRSAASMANGHLAANVPASALVEALRQWLVRRPARNFGEVGAHRSSNAWAGRP